MKELTSRQEEYLLFFSTLQGNKKCISDASNQFKVSKPTVFNIAEGLEEQGLIIKGAGGEIVFTDLGKEYITPKLRICKKIEKWLEADLGLPPIIAEFEARKMFVTLQQDTIHALLRNIAENKATKKSMVIKSNFEDFADGDYEVNFSIYKSDRNDISMGDKGFSKPAIFRKENGLVSILLFPRKLKYVSKKRNRLQGSLERLWYVSQNKWFEAEMSSENCYTISEEALVFNKEKDTCEIKIRARATVGNLKMPEGEAVIIFDISDMEKGKT